MPTYKYESLPNNTIRLLSLFPGEGDDDLEGELQVAELDRLPDYEAISYVWGSPICTDDLLCIGNIIKITPSLAITLRKLRKSAIKRVLWIDQTCVNQADIHERASQVNIMGKIYEGAQNVVMWLGEDPFSEASIAMQFIQEIRGRTDRLFPQYTACTDMNLLQDDLPQRQSPKWQAFRRLISLPYWERMWIVQEVVLSSSAITLWGDCEIGWDDILQVMRWAYQSDSLHQRSPLVDRENLSRFLSLYFGKASLWRLLHMTQERKATDERDRVFALLGLCEDEDIVADYTKSPFQVFRDTALYFMNQRRDLDVLSKIGDTPDSWSTWVTNWRSWGTPLCAENRCSFCACADTQLRVNRLSDEDRVLSLEGVKQGSVTKVGFVMEREGSQAKENEEEHRAVFIQRFQEAWDIAKGWWWDSNKDALLLKSLLWTFLCGGASDDNRAKEAVWDDQIYPQFAQYSAYSLGYCLPNGRLDTTRCLRHYLAFAEMAMAAYDKSWRDHFWRQHLAEDPTWQEWQDWATSRLSPYHQNPHMLQKAVEMICPLIYSEIASWRFQEEYWFSGRDRRFFVTDDGLLAMGPRSMQEGDIVVVLFGGKVPFVLRPSLDGYRLVGECYVNGIMNGEFIQELKRTEGLEAHTELFSLL